MPVFAILLVAAALVGFAWTRDETTFAYVGGSLALLVLIATLALEIYQRRSAAGVPTLSTDEAEAPGVDDSTAGGDSSDRPGEAEPVAAVLPVTEDDVHVIPGRRRYHHPGCRLLVGREREVLTLEDALDEGFTPCSLCLEAQHQKRA